MVDISNLGRLPEPGRLGRINPTGPGWSNVSENELFNAVLYGPRFREPAGIAGRPDAGDPLEFEMVADEVQFGAEMMVTDSQLALLRKIPSMARQGRLPQKVFKYQDRNRVEAIRSDNNRRGDGGGGGGGGGRGYARDPSQDGSDQAYIPY